MSYLYHITVYFHYIAWLLIKSLFICYESQNSSGKVSRARVISWLTSGDQQIRVPHHVFVKSYGGLVCSKNASVCSSSITSVINFRSFSNFNHICQRDKSANFFFSNLMKAGTQGGEILTVPLHRKRVQCDITKHLLSTGDVWGERCFKCLNPKTIFHMTSFLPTHQRLLTRYTAVGNFISTNAHKTLC